jgi:hypothetical protein
MKQGNDIGGTDPANIAAERAFFNFSLIAAADNSFELFCSEIPEIVLVGDSIPLSVFVEGTGPFTYAWSATCGGEFRDPSDPSTSFTPDQWNQMCPVLSLPR